MGLNWHPWSSVSQGSSMPGAPIAAIPWEDSFAVFISDPSGGIYAIKSTPGYGWEIVPGRSTTPGALITALLSGNLFTLFMADVNGEIFTTSGIPYQSWQPWTSVSQGSSTPGAPVAAIPWGRLQIRQQQTALPCLFRIPTAGFTRSRPRLAMAGK
jgi:hypothetical protein